jgi:hypothetical protein
MLDVGDDDSILRKRFKEEHKPFSFSFLKKAGAYFSF